MICKNCGANNENNSTVCFKCGKPLENNELVNNNGNITNKKNNKIPYIIIGAIVILIIVIGLVSKNVMSNSNKPINNNNENNNLPNDDDSIKKRIEELKNEGYEEVEINYNLEKLTTTLEQDYEPFQKITNNEKSLISIDSDYDSILDGNIIIEIENNILYFSNGTEKFSSNINDAESMYYIVRENTGVKEFVMYIKTLSNKTYEYIGDPVGFFGDIKEEINKIKSYNNNLAINFVKYYEWWYASDCTSDSNILIGEDVNGEQYIVPIGIKYSDLKYSTNSRLFITNDNYLIDIFTGENINDSKVLHVFAKDDGWNCDTFDYVIIFENGIEEKF